MSECIRINSTQNLPEESTLLIHYTITCTGTWDLLQFATAYRNVCDTEWTIMYANDQHPYHTDFPIRVTTPGYSATFAWNYQGIRGIDRENFDSNHSYLTQLGIFNLECSVTGHTGGGGGMSGSTSGNISFSGRPNFRSPPIPIRSFPQPPFPPPPPPGDRFRFHLISGAPLGGPPGGGGGTGNPPRRVGIAVPEIRRPRRDPILSGQPTDITRREDNLRSNPGGIFNPERPPNSISFRRGDSVFGETEGYQNGISLTWNPVNQAGFSSNPIVTSNPSVLPETRDRNEFNNYNRPRRELNSRIEDDNGGGTLNFPNSDNRLVSNDSDRIDYSEPGNKASITNSSQTRLYSSDITPIKSTDPIESLKTENVLEDSVCNISVGRSTVSYGERIVVSAAFYPKSNTVIASAELFSLTDSGDKIRLFYTEQRECNSNAPLVLAGQVGSHVYRNHVYFVFIVKDNEGKIIGVNSVFVNILPKDTFVQTKPAVYGDKLPQAILAYTTLSNANYVDLEFDTTFQREILIAPITLGQTEDLELLLVSQVGASFEITAYDPDLIPLAVIDRSVSPLRKGEEYIHPEAHSCYLKIPDRNATQTRIVLRPLDAVSGYHRVRLFFSQKFALKTPTITVSSFNGSSANVAISSPYCSSNTKLIVNGKEKGRISSTSSSYIGLTSQLGALSLSGVALTAGDWLSVFLEEKGKYNLSTPVYEVRYQ